MGDDRNTEGSLEAAATTATEQPRLDWLAALYHDHARAVVRAAYRITGSREDAEDVLQTVFGRLAARSRPPELEHRALPYLLRAASNAAIDVVRARPRHAAASLGELPGGAAIDPSPELDRLQSSRELRHRLRDAVAALEPRHAGMFVLRYFEDLDNSTIAELFDTSPGTVAVTLHRVRVRLAEQLGPFLGGSR